ncbi:MAG: helix-turn-helix domain-containing protein [Clostridia bacterium]|nr:helix-turn-helix domain-containing protein [Clostridia bacterium]
MRAFEMIYRDEVSSKAVSVYRYLLDRQGKYEFCYVSHRRMAGDLKISVSTVKRALDELERKGYVGIEQQRRANGSRCCNIYRCKSP